MHCILTVPHGASIAVSAGQKIDIGDPLYTLGSGGEATIPLARLLHIPPQKIFKHLKKFIGDSVKKGEIIAESETWFTKKQYLADTNGVISGVNHFTGEITLSTGTEDIKTVESFFTGIVEDVKPTAITVEVKAKHRVPLETVSADFGGQLYIVQGGKVEPERVLHSVVVIENPTPTEIAKIEALQAAGIIMQTKQKTSLAYALMPDIQELAAYDKKFVLCTQKEGAATIY